MRRSFRRLTAEAGFTLMEVLIAMIVIAILVGIAVPAYLKFRDRGNSTAAQQNIRAMIAAVEAYRADNGGAGYAGMTIGGATGLRAVYDEALRGWDTATSTGVTILSAGAATYCVKSVSGGMTYYKAGPNVDAAQTPTCA